MNEDPKPIRAHEISMPKRKPPTSSRIPQGRQLSELEQALASTRAEIEQALRRFAKRILPDESEVA